MTYLQPLLVKLAILINSITVTLPLSRQIPLKPLDQSGKSRCDGHPMTDNDGIATTLRLQHHLAIAVKHAKIRSREFPRLCPACCIHFDNSFDQLHQAQMMGIIDPKNTWQNAAEAVPPSPEAPSKLQKHHSRIRLS